MTLSDPHPRICARPGCGTRLRAGNRGIYCDPCVDNGLASDKPKREAAVLARKAKPKKEAKVRRNVGETRRMVLELLKARPGVKQSTVALAEKLSVGRYAINKAIEGLRKDGEPITVVPRERGGGCWWGEHKEGRDDSTMAPGHPQAPPPDSSQEELADEPAVGPAPALPAGPPPFAGRKDLAQDYHYGPLTVAIVVNGDHVLNDPEQRAIALCVTAIDALEDAAQRARVGAYVASRYLP